MTICLTATVLAFGSASSAHAQDTTFQQIPDRGVVRQLPEGTLLIKGLQLDDGVRDALRQMGAEAVAGLDETHYLYDADARSWVRLTARLDSLREEEAEATDSVNAVLRDSIHTLRYRLDYCKQWQSDAAEVLEDRKSTGFWGTAENILWGAAGYGVGQIACGTR